MKYGWLFWFLSVAGCGESANEGSAPDNVVDDNATLPDPHALKQAKDDLDSAPTGSQCNADTPPSPEAFASSTAIAKGSSAIAAWASEVLDIDFGSEVTERYRDPTQALGPAEGNSSNVVSLGDGGAITVGFGAPLSDGPGPDLCVFENSFSDNFLEFAFVEVSSDAKIFVRFDAWSRVPSPVDSYGTVEPALVAGLAGKYRQGFCTPFDLAQLGNRPEVQSGQLNLNAVAYVRILDIAGDGRELDCTASPIYDPFPTSGGAGFDLDAVAVLTTTR